MKSYVNSPNGGVPAALEQIEDPESRIEARKWNNVRSFGAWPVLSVVDPYWPRLAEVGRGCPSGRFSHRARKSGQEAKFSRNLCLAKEMWPTTLLAIRFSTWPGGLATSRDKSARLWRVPEAFRSS